MKPTVLITGGNGFIGRALTQKLLQAGYQVRVTTRKKVKNAHPQADLSFVQVDYSDVKSLEKALQGCEGVFSLAGTLFGFSYKDFEKGNVIAVQNLVQAANHTRGLRTFVHTSSLAASGYAKDASRPRLESYAPMPVSDYGRTKLLGEKAVRRLNQHIKRTILRPAIVYGKNDSGVSKIAAWVKRGLMINTSGQGRFSFVFVDDLATALITAYQRKDTQRETYFIAESKTYSWDYFITQMARAMHVKKPWMPNAPLWLMKTAAFLYETCARITGAQPALNYDKVAEADIKGHWICSSKKWQKLTGQKFTPLAEGLRKSF